MTYLVGARISRYIKSRNSRGSSRNCIGFGVIIVAAIKEGVLCDLETICYKEKRM